MQVNDRIRSHDFSPTIEKSSICYLEGVVIKVEGTFAYFAVTKRVWAGCEETVEPFEVGRAPVNGASVFDDPENPRIQVLGPAPAHFELDREYDRSLHRYIESLKVRGMYEIVS